MLLPTIAKVSQKGQVLIPAQMRKALGLKPEELVYIIPYPEEGRIELEITKAKDPIELSYGMLADIKPERSWTKELLKERKRDRIKEESKFNEKNRS